MSFARILAAIAIILVVLLGFIMAFLKRAPRGEETSRGFVPDPSESGGTAESKAAESRREPQP